MIKCRYYTALKGLAGDRSLWEVAAGLLINNRRVVKR